ncbi:MAG: hypothetical protein R2726_05240 [Acidimicrobiales bacterium]
MRSNPARAWISALALVAVVGWTATSAAQPGDTTVTGAPLAPGFAPAVGTVTVTGTAGGPPHGGFTPAEAATFSGAKGGRKAVLYRRSAQDSGCAVPPTAPTCNESWLWDGDARTWTQVPNTITKARQGQSAAATASGQEGLAWIYSGGYPQPGDPAPWDEADMYVLGDDLQWRAAPCSPSCAPRARDGSAGAASATDSLLFGGEWAGSADPSDGAPDFDASGFSNQVWRWNGQDWDLLPVTGTPPARRAASAFGFDGRDYILFGGARIDVVDDPNVPGGKGVQYTTFADTWRLSKAAGDAWSWSKVCDRCGPPFRFQTNLPGLYREGTADRGAVLTGGFQFTNGAVVLGAGGGQMSVLSDVWVWNGQTWTAADPGLAPCPVDLTGPSTLPPCVTDPAIPYTPFAAPLPGIGAAAWTAGSCTATTPAPRPGASAQLVCERSTTQVQLVSPPAPVPGPTPPPTVIPRFTG